MKQVNADLRALAKKEAEETMKEFENIRTVYEDFIERRKRVIMGN